MLILELLMLSAGRKIKDCIDQPPDLNPFSNIQLNGQSISACILAKMGSTAPCMNPITSLDIPDHLEGLNNSSWNKFPRNVQQPVIVHRIIKCQNWKGSSRCHIPMFSKLQKPLVGYKNQFSRAQPSFYKNEIEYLSITLVARVHFVLFYLQIYACVFCLQQHLFVTIGNFKDFKSDRYSLPSFCRWVSLRKVKLLLRDPTTGQGNRVTGILLTYI